MYYKNMGIFEPITHKTEIEEIYAEAESIQNDSINRFNNAKEAAESKLEQYGKQKVLVFGKCISAFCSNLKVFKNVEVTELSNNTNSIIKIEETQELALIEQSVDYSKDLLKIGLVSVGAGTLTTIAAFGGAKMIAGTAVGAKLATFAAKSVATKVAVVASFAFVPALIVFGIVAGIKGKERLAKAKSDLAKVRAEAKKTDMYSRIYEEIVEVLDSYSLFVSRFEVKYTRVLNRIKEIISVYSKDSNGKINFESLSEVDQRTFHLAWLMTQLYYGVLKQPLINEEGKAMKESKIALVEANNAYIELKKKFPNEVSNIAEEPKGAAKGLLIASFVFFGLFLSYSIYCFYEGKIYCGLAFAGVTALSFPFSVFLKKMPTRLKVLLRVLRIVFTIVGAAFALIYLFNR